MIAAPKLQVPRERPILFSAPMVLALLEGRKTQTRRVVKPSPKWDGHGWVWEGRKGTARWTGDSPQACALVHGFRPECIYGQRGDRLWVKETWAEIGPGPIYRASDADHNPGMKWRPSIFMPRWASRITLEITEVRVQRLQDISEEDAKAEGLQWAPAADGSNTWGLNEVPGSWMPRAWAAFSALWDSINGAGSWSANPWVWAISFRGVRP